MSGWAFDERFKAWAEREAVTLLTPNSTLRLATSKDMEAAFLGGINSRDAEVQALRERNDRMAHELFVLGVDIDAPNDGEGGVE